LIDGWRQTSPAVVDGDPRRMKLGEVQQVLRMLQREAVPIANWARSGIAGDYAAYQGRGLWRNTSAGGW
jgi:hypothetical protein